METSTLKGKLPKKKHTSFIHTSINAFVVAQFTRLFVCSRAIHSASYTPRLFVRSRAIHAPLTHFPVRSRAIHSASYTLACS